MCLVCDPIEDEYGLWPETDVGELVIRSCLESYETGTITRQCRDDRTWGMIQSQCKVENSYLGGLEDQVDAVLNNTEVDSVRIVENVTGTLEEITDEGDHFDNNSQIIHYTINIADIVIRVVQETGDISNEIKDNVVGALGNIIDSEFEDQWNKERVIKGSHVLETAELFLATATDIKCNGLNDNEIIGIDKEHIYAEIGKKSDEVTFPNTALAQKSEIIISSETLSNIGLSTVCFNGAFFTPDFDFVEQEVLINGTVESFEDTLKINSAIISIQLDYQGPVKNLVPPVRVTHRIKDTTHKYPVCVFWDFDIVDDKKNGAWSTEGCYVTSYNSTHVVCSCNHLTNFAILMSPSSVSGRHTEILSIISAVGCGISIICLILTMILHCMLWRLVKSDRAVVLMNLCVALLLALTIFLAGVNRTESRTACIAIAALIQLFFLAVFFFMLLIGLEILICVVHVFMTKFRIKILIPLAWLFPLMIVGISLGVSETKGYGNDQFCWLDAESGLIWAFIGPALFIILMNFIIIMIVFKKMASSQVLKSKSKKTKVKTGLRSLCVLVPVMGLTWFMGILSVNSDLVIFQYLFCIFNTLQGLFIFLFHCVFNRQIRDALKHRNERKKSLQTFSSGWRKQTRSGSAVSFNNSR